MPSFAGRYAEYQAAVECALPLSFPEQADAVGGTAVKAARYSLLGGGKRIRPVLLLAVTDMLGGNREEAMPFACATEMIHTYSLIHDDLPCMDDDDLRRGRPTCHKAFSEAMAVLAGDALLNRAFEVMLAAISPVRPATLEAARIIARAAGSQGMIGGQSLDLSAEGRAISPDELHTLHSMKTGALLKAPILAAASLAGAPADTAGHLSAYADAIGLAFQIQDDILDATADSNTLGKSAGKDLRDSKPTYASLFGLTAARGFLAEAISDARTALDNLLKSGLDPGFLQDMTDYLLTRSN